MEEILALGASIIIRPSGPNGAEGFKFLNCKYCVAVEINDFRNGYTGNHLDEIFARALEWIKEVKFYDGPQWTAEQIANMSLARANSA